MAGRDASTMRCCQGARCVQILEDVTLATFDSRESRTAYVNAGGNGKADVDICWMLTSRNEFELILGDAAMLRMEPAAAGPIGAERMCPRQPTPAISI